MDIYIVMGVFGSGKSTIGQLLAEKFQMPFVEGDDFHPHANVTKMASGQALHDADRYEWIAKLSAEINAKSGSCVAACSSLNGVVRSWLLEKIKGRIQFICLHGDRDLLLRRLNSRTGHFFKSSLLDTQLNAFVPPQNAIVVDVDNKAECICEEIIAFLADK